MKTKNVEITCEVLCPSYSLLEIHEKSVKSEEFVFISVSTWTLTNFVETVALNHLKGFTYHTKEKIKNPSLYEKKEKKETVNVTS